MIEREVNPDNISQADIVVALASYQEADTISYPTRQADLGMRKYFSDMKPVIINADNNSPDNTEQAFLNTETEVSKIYITTPPDMSGKGYNFENIFRRALELDAKILICVDADLESITPKWIKYFGEAILDGYDYTTPLYSRHKYDGTITNNICYPLVYGLLGQNLRQPIGGDFALGHNLLEHLLKITWHRTTEEYGIDIFQTMNAILGGFKVCETGLGAKIHKPSAPKLGPMFSQVVGTAFFLITRHIDFWKDIKHLRNCPLFGMRHLKAPQELNINAEIILTQALEGFEQTKDDFKDNLSSKVYKEIKHIFESKKKEDMNNLNAELWCKVVYDMIAAFSKIEENASIIESLKSLYFGRVVSFMDQTRDMSSEEAEEFIIEQAQVFFDNRKYLLDKIL